jgi:predicted  nucleic acid-binding Zn-ribbon protein
MITCKECGTTFDLVEGESLEYCLECGAIINPDNPDTEWEEKLNWGEKGRPE